MTRLALIGTIGVVVVAAILGLIYAVGKQDVDDAPPTAQSEPANTAAGTSAPDSAAAANPGAAAPATGNTTGNTTGTAGNALGNAASPAPANTAATEETQPSSANGAAAQPASNGAQVASTANAAAAPATPPEIKPSFDVVRVNPNGDAVVAGRAAPGAEITLLDNGHTIGSAEADDRGEWVLLPDSSVDPGEHKFSLKAVDGNGRSLESEKEVIVVVPKPAEDIAGQPVTRPSGALAIEVPKHGEAPTQLLNAPGQTNQTVQPVTSDAAAAAAARPALSLDTIDYTQDGRAMVSGHAQPDSNLMIYLDNRSLGMSKTDGTGRWTFVPETKAPAGDHELRVDMVDGNGKVLARVKVPFAQPDFSTLALNDNSVIVQPGNSLWRIARRSYGDGVLFTVIYEANKDRIGDPNLIYPGQVFQLPAKKN